MTKSVMAGRPVMSVFIAFAIAPFCFAKMNHYPLMSLSFCANGTMLPAPRPNSTVDGDMANTINELQTLLCKSGQLSPNSGAYASFSSIGLVCGLAVYAPMTDQNYGNQKLSLPPENIRSNPAGFAVMLKRGETSMAEKVQAASEIGAKALLVGNHDNGCLLSWERKDERANENPFLVVVLLQSSIYGDLVGLSRRPGANLTLCIEPRTSPPSSFAQVLLPILLPALLSTLGVSLIILVIVYLCLRFRHVHARQGEWARSEVVKALNQEAVQSMTTKEYKKPNVDADPEAPEETFCSGCAICLDDFEAGDCVRELECRHVFHTACVDPWLLEKGSCPYCKYSIVTKSYTPQAALPLAPEPSQVTSANESQTGAESIVALNHPRGSVFEVTFNQAVASVSVASYQSERGADLTTSQSDTVVDMSPAQSESSGTENSLQTGFSQEVTLSQPPADSPDGCHGSSTA